jgi:hypothetical protein
MFSVSGVVLFHVCSALLVYMLRDSPNAQCYDFLYDLRSSN